MFVNRGIFAFIFYSLFSGVSSHATVTQGVYGYLGYRLFTPSTKPVGTLVVLHGCKQDASRIEAVTQFDKEAEKHHFQVLYPNQNLMLNSDHCWNWFLPVNQTRVPQIGAYGPELSTLALLVKSFKGPKYLVGFSAGSAMGANFISCYPDLFVGFALHSGPVFKASSSILDAEQSLTTGSKYPISKAVEDAYSCSGRRDHQGRNPPVKLSGILIHGQNDVRVYPIHLQQNIQFFTEYFKLLSNNQATQSHLQTFLIPSLAHEWSGGAAGFPNSNPNTLKVSEVIANDFTKNL